MKSAKATMADRGLALGALHTARSDVAAKRSKLMKLRGTPGIRVRGHTMLEAGVPLDRSAFKKKNHII